MTRTVFVAATALLFALPATAQSQQERLDARYDRELAAGYKALMLCGAIGNAMENGTERSAESVEGLELKGIDPVLAAIIPELEYQIVQGKYGVIEEVQVSVTDAMPPRRAIFRQDKGCTVLPIGTPVSAERLDYLPRPSGMANQRPPQGAALAKAMAKGMNDGYGSGTRTTAIVVSRAGQIRGELYHPGLGQYTPQRTWSVAKSIAATLVGAAVQRNEAIVTASAGLGEDDSDPRRAITIDHLLRMASGRYSDTSGNRTDPLYWGGATVEEVALDWPLIAAPGSSYRYANNDTLAAVNVLKSTFDAHPPAAFFKMLGMRHTVAETDWQGNYILSSQVWSTARDLVKFGQLYLNDGKLADGTRVLPEGWVQYVSSPSGPQPEGAFGYGAGFWLMNRSEGVPADTFAAFGNRGQYVVIVPSRQVVIVRRGEDPAGASFDIAGFTRNVLAALPAE